MSDDLTPLALWGAYVLPSAHKMTPIADQRTGLRCGWSLLLAAFRLAGRLLRIFPIGQSLLAVTLNELLLVLITIDSSRFTEWAAPIMSALKDIALVVTKTSCWDMGL